MRNTRGFSLLELMFVVVITGILAAIAFPSYMNSVRKAHRTDAKVALNNIAVRLQRCFTVNSKFDTTAGACQIKDMVTTGGGITSENGYYLITGTNFAPATFTIQADPVSGKGQEYDTSCIQFSLDQQGKKTAKDTSNSDVTSNCW